MAEFTIHTQETAPGGSKEQLAAALAQLGFIPNLYGVMAEAPVLLEAYRQLSKVLEKGSLSPVERQVAYLAISQANGCQYCLAAHGTLASLTGVAPDVVASASQGQPLADAKLEALRKTTAELVQQRGWLPDQALSAFLAAGYSRASLLELVACVGLKTMSNYTNHLAHTPVDAAFQPAGAAVSR